MKQPVPNVRHGVVWALSLGLVGALLLSHAQAQQKFEIKNVAEKKLKQLPAGPLFWRVENFPTLAQAQAAAGDASLVAEVSGKVWLFTLGPKGGTTAGGSQGGRNRPGPSDQRARVSAAHQSCRRPPGGEDASSYSSRLRGLLRSVRPPGPEDATWRELCRGGPVHERAWCRHGDGSLQRRYERSGPARHVCGRRHPAVLVASQARVTPAKGGSHEACRCHARPYLSGIVQWRLAGILDD